MRSFLCTACDPQEFTETSIRFNIQNYQLGRCGFTRADNSPNGIDGTFWNNLSWKEKPNSKKTSITKVKCAHKLSAILASAPAPGLPYSPAHPPSLWRFPQRVRPSWTTRTRRTRWTAGRCTTRQRQRWKWRWNLPPGLSGPMGTEHDMAKVRQSVWRSFRWNPADSTAINNQPRTLSRFFFPFCPLNALNINKTNLHCLMVLSFQVNVRGTLP